MERIGWPGSSVISGRNGAEFALGEGIASGSKGSDKDLGLGDLPNKASDGKLKSLQPQTAKTGRK